MKHFLRWVSPLILGVIEFYFLRLATDPSRGTEWWPDFNNQLRALLLTILLCYIVDYCLRNIFHKYIFRKEISIGKEYSYITLGLFITTNVTLSITYVLGLIELGQPISDYILVNIIYVPLNVLYYTIIRNKEISNYYQHQSLLLEKLRNEQLDTELLRYQLYDIKQKVTVKQELDYLEAYIQFQRLRMSERLVLTEEYDEHLHTQEIHPLLFQPLVENTFKYVSGAYWIHFSLKAIENKLVFTAWNSVDQPAIAHRKKSSGQIS